MVKSPNMPLNRPAIEVNSPISLIDLKPQNKNVIIRMYTIKIISLPGDGVLEFVTNSQK